MKRSQTPAERAARTQVYPACNKAARLGGFGQFRAYLLGAAALLSANVAGAGSPALAPIDAGEESRLKGQADAVRRFELPIQGRTYLGALSYQVTDHSCERVWSLIEAPAKHFAQALPATRSVKLTGDKEPNKLLVTHGNAIITGSYTVDFVSDRERYLARFWLDHSRPKDVQDVFGYVRLKDFGPARCLITVAVAVDPGSGVLASMVRGTIHKYLLKSAGRFARYTRKVLPKESALATVHASN